MKPRGWAVLAAGLMLVSTACSNDDTAARLAEAEQRIAELEQQLLAATSTTVPSGETSSTTDATTSSVTTTTALPGAYAVAAADTCVIGVSPGDEINVRSGPGSGQDLVGTLADDAAGVRTTGWAALDDDGDEWRQIAYEDASAWVFAAFLTPCTVGPATGYCVNEAACTDTPNVRTGLGSGFDIIGTLAVDAVGIQGTGATAFDDRDRPWVQIRHEGGAGWVAGWLLDAEPCSPAECPPPPLPWTITADAVGPIELGMPITDLGTATSLDWAFEEPCAAGCLTGTAAGLDGYIISHDGTTVDEVDFDGDVETEDGMRPGDTLATVQAIYGARVLDVGDDGFGGTAVWIDADG
ncbi:MAG TPA: hypothetical protein VLS92_09750, partial [Acidimicrobiia bacterium]|nr:hypothetical protein [Acidimicrobiia bacterium]